LAERESKPIPEGWAINREGEITTDAKEALLGAVLPLAGHKGYGMALIIDILSGVLTGSAYGTKVGSFVPPDYSKPLDFGHILLAIDIDSFMEREEFNARLTDFISMIKESDPARGFSKILIPGEGRKERNSFSYQEGIKLQKSTLEKLKELCIKYKINQDIF
jgi:LDH2 family malate/lactate/ureidoglycolate dehydrogenase